MTHAGRQPDDARHSRWRIGEFEFDAQLGELVAIAHGSPQESIRLAPKPAQLLALLIDKQGELLSHEEIRDQLWPDVQVEFDQSVHFCVRQIRSALGDSAGDAKYVQTLPRRGYRLAVRVQQLPVRGLPTTDRSEGEASSGLPHQQPHRQRHQQHQRARSARATALGGVCVVLVALIFAWSSVGGGHAPPLRVRLAIMPMQPPDASFGSTAGAIATHLVALLGNDRQLAVIGPTTTVRFAGSQAPVADAVAELAVAYIINGRFTQRDDQPAILMELIRASDGAHIWVRWFSVDESPQDVARIIAAAFAEKVIRRDEQ